MIAVVVPCYRVKDQIIKVINSIDRIVEKIYIIDDLCPDNTGNYVQETCSDSRVEVIFHEKNGGVGAAVKSGYKKALKDGAEYIIKIDGDGQMDSSMIPDIVMPLIKLKADYVKGNRFYELAYLKSMPRLRLLGNSMLSLINKFTSGYWSIMDPTNGFTAINSTALRMLPLAKIDDRYFFESDMLFRLGTIRAVITDIPMPAKYGQENSSLSIKKVLLEFPPKYINRFFKRLIYNYFLRDFNVGTIELVFGFLFVFFGFFLGLYNWYIGEINNTPATSGTVMLAALPIILGFQLLIAGLQFDISNIPKEPLILKYAKEKIKIQSNKSRV